MFLEYKERILNTEEKKELLSKVKLFVLDMDGTFYLGDRIFDGSLDFLKKVEEQGKEFLFFTNNSSKSPEIYMEKLAKMNCFIRQNQILTSANVTISYLKEYYPGKSVYLVGTPALEASFLQAGIPLTGEQPDIVVLGFDTTLTYEKLERACTFLRNGALFLATHKDINCPTEDGFIPDCGAMCQLITASTGCTPLYLGKPSPQTLEMVLLHTGYKKEEVAFVGDRLYTDVATGTQNGAKGILVLSGETKLEDLKDSPFRPNGVFLSLQDMISYM